ncbi:hypothetical protein GPECTOR_1g54 [Gonium pectorale]|uniref:Uncharacterized protein n=1 Tax=Gonium pectorale TaxID=33097 RepID=A0A150H4R8_GONPE|nr:hypothetical protein GPECTOR_1g54 [Gonium pectorale]|eukprot:KXZ56600.1 hypothetical protein GPECTOR_1g54 [Gonium pectorale]
MTTQYSKAMLQLEQERHSAVTQQREIETLRQKLRAHGAVSVIAAFGSGRSPGGGLKRPLSVAMSGMDDLLEEAAADLEQLEGHIANVTNRLVDMQVQNLQLAQQVAAAMRSRADAEADATKELQRAKAFRDEADSLQRSIAADKQSLAQLAAQLSDAKADLQQLVAEANEQRQALQRCKDAEQEHACTEEAERRAKQVSVV